MLHWRCNQFFEETADYYSLVSEILWWKGEWERWNCLSEGEVMELTIYKVLSNTQSNLLIFFCYRLHSSTKHLITCSEPMLIQQSTYPHAYANLSICLSAFTQWGQRRFRPWDEPFSETSHFPLRWLTIYSFSSPHSMTQNVFKENTKMQLKSRITIRNSKDSR